ncbi:MAG: metal ABC transporter substrate-binding protein [Candidatus Binatia bacterium]
MHWGWVICAVWLWGGTLAAPAAAAVRVVATIFPVADMVRQIGGELVDVATLLPAGASPHTFEPTPDQVRTVAEATVFVEIGAGLDTWAGKLKAARSGPMKVITLTAGLALLGAAPEHGEPHGGDPHVWLDPVLVRDHLVPAIARGLSQADPGHLAEFQRRATDFQAALTQLDADIRATLAPAVNRNYVAFHSAWRYFGQRYDLREVAVVESFPGKEASALEIARVVEKARAAHVRVVLIEPQFNPRMAEQIAHEIGAQVLLVDPLGAPLLSDRDHYIDLLRHNLQVFARALL